LAASSNRLAPTFFKRVFPGELPLLFFREVSLPQSRLATGIASPPSTGDPSWLGTPPPSLHLYFFSECRFALKTNLRPFGSDLLPSLLALAPFHERTPSLGVPSSSSDNSFTDFFLLKNLVGESPSAVRADPKALVVWSDLPYFLSRSFSVLRDGHSRLCILRPVPFTTQDP